MFAHSSMSEQELLFASSLKPTWRKNLFLQTEKCETDSCGQMKQKYKE